MKIRNLIQIGLLGTALGVSAGAAPQYDGPRYDQRAERRDIDRDVRRRDELARRVERDRRDVEQERHRLRQSTWFTAGHESRELRNARQRLDRDSAELRAVDEHLNRDMRRVR